MSKIFEALRESDDGEDVHITSEDMKTLVDILTCVRICLEEKRLWFNGKSTQENLQYIEFLKRMSKKFANIKIEAEQ